MTESGTRPSRIRILLLQVGSVLLAVVLLLAALRGVDYDELRSALAGARYILVVPLVAAAMLSHLIRAWRWNILIDSAGHEGGRRPMLLESFGALMVGYMINYVLPRLGEVARAGVLSRRTGISFSRLIGTVAAERVLDVATLAAALVVVGVMLRSQLSDLLSRIMGTSLSLWSFAAGVAVLGLVLWGLIVLARRGISGTSRLARFVQTFLQGLASLVKIKRKLLVALQTAAIWFCYWVMAYLPLEMLGLTRSYGVGLREAWSIMNIGAVGVLIPSPGGIGSYHLITVETLTVLFGVHPSPAASYAVLTHGIQFIAYIAVGAAALAMLGLSVKGAIQQDGGAVAPEEPTKPAAS